MRDHFTRRESLLSKPSTDSLFFSVTGVAQGKDLFATGFRFFEFRLSRRGGEARAHGFEGVLDLRLRPILAVNMLLQQELGTRRVERLDLIKLELRGRTPHELAKVAPLSCFSLFFFFSSDQAKP